MMGTKGAPRPAPKCKPRLKRRIEMTDRFSSLTVVLKVDVSKGEAEYLFQAIRQFSAVLKVYGDVGDVNACVAEARAKHKIKQRVMDALG